MPYNKRSFGWEKTGIFRHIRRQRSEHDVSWRPTEIDCQKIMNIYTMDLGAQALARLSIKFAISAVVLTLIITWLNRRR